MKKPKIYIAGKVTGTDKLECIKKFDQAVKKVEALDCEAVNPLTVVGTWNIEWDQAMKKCIKALLECDAVYHLPCTQFSEGAQIELQLARYLAMPTHHKVEELKSYLK